MSSGISRHNRFLSAPLAPLFARTALPIVMIMSMTGLFSVVDAIFLGLFVGRDAVSAVTVIFPVTMLLFAVSALVSGGMSSLLARRLGANDIDGAGDIFAAAHGLAVAAALLLSAMFLLTGDAITLRAAAGNTIIADMAHAYLGISVLATPLMFFVALHSDGLRNEGRAPQLALLSVLVTIANIGFNYLFIAVLDLGVAGSAYGTVAAQLLAVIMVIAFRTRARTPLPLSILYRHPWLRQWGDIMALGAPQCLSYIGISLVSGTVIAALQVGESANYAATVAAYGIITRIFGFAFLPMLGIAMAMQSIVGNNVGAGLHARSDTTLRYALAVGGIYCLVIQAVLMTSAIPIGRLFVDDALVIAEVGRILPQLVLFYLLSGPMLTLASYFQAIGDAARAATLSLFKPFLLSPVLIIILSATMGEPGIWVASPLADGVMIIVVLLVLARSARRTGRRMGMYLSTRKRPDCQSVMLGSMNSESVGTRWSTTWIAIGAGIICGMQVGKAPPMIGGIRESLDIDLVSAGFYMSTINGLAVATGIIAGVFADQIGRRRAIALGLVAIILGNVVGAMAETMPVMYASRFLEAMGFVGVVTAVPGLISDLVASKNIRVALSAWSIYMPAGFCLMMAAAPLLMEPAGWRSIWWMNAVLVSLYLALFMAATRGVGGRPAQARTLSGLRAVIRLPGPWLLGMIFMSYTTQWFGVLTWLPTIMEQVGLSAADAGLGVALVVGANMAGCLGSGPLLQLGLARWKIAVVCSLSLSAFAFGIYDETLLPEIRLALAALFSAIGGLIPGAMLAGVPMHSPSPANVGTTNGVVVQCTSLGSLLGPPAVAWIAVQADGDFGAARWLVLVAGLLGAILALTLRTVEQRMTATARQE